jgi:transposase
MSEPSKRRKWKATDKLRIVLAGMQAGVEVSELCRREGVNPTMYYGWKKKLLSSAGRIFASDLGKGKAQQEKQEAALRRFKDVIAELTAENLELKKGLSG